MTLQRTSSISARRRVEKSHASRVEGARNRIPSSLVPQWRRAEARSLGRPMSRDRVGKGVSDSSDRRDGHAQSASIGW